MVRTSLAASCLDTGIRDDGAIVGQQLKEASGTAFAQMSDPPVINIHMLCIVRHVLQNLLRNFCSWLPVFAFFMMQFLVQLAVADTPFKPWYCALAFVASMANHLLKHISFLLGFKQGNGNLISRSATRTPNKSRDPQQ